jgi:hypothetical protein
MIKELARRLKINGQPVPMAANQMVINFDDFDLGVPLPTPPQYPAPQRELQKCVCGAHAIGIEPFMTGHCDWCEVHEDKTPLARTG